MIKATNEQTNKTNKLRFNFLFSSWERKQYFSNTKRIMKNMARRTGCAPAQRVKKKETEKLKRTSIRNDQTTTTIMPPKPNLKAANN